MKKRKKIIEIQLEINKEHLRPRRQCPVYFGIVKRDSDLRISHINDLTSLIFILSVMIFGKILIEN